MIPLLRYCLTIRALFALGLLFTIAAESFGLDYVLVHRGGKEYRVIGRNLVTAADGGILFEANDGELWLIQRSEIARGFRDEKPFVGQTKEAIAAKYLAELPRGFKAHSTAHYVILYDTSDAYARWCGSLLEQTQSAFINFWSRRGMELHEPDVPLVAIIFADQRAYLEHIKAEVGDESGAIQAYYHLVTNRMTMYDPTRIGLKSRGAAVTNGEIVRAVLADRQATMAVSNVVHEATHQISLNSGMFIRLSDCPLWISEGVAVFFETPDLTNRRGWGGVGEVNHGRLTQFRTYLPKRPPDSLKRLIESDKRFRDVNTSLDTYAEAWALTYFLCNQKPKELTEYLKLIGAKIPCVADSPEERVEEFEVVFGDWRELDQEFLRYISRVR